MADLGRTVELVMYYGAKPRLRELARNMRRNPTEAENVLWQHLRNKKLEGRIFRRQHPIDIFIVDFYCHSEQLIIEVDGGIHEETDIKTRDQGRTDEMERFDLRVIRFTNEDILKNMESVLRMIKENFLPSSRPSLSGEGLGEG
jgi:very-short-patch-repair endonuclease